MPVRLPALALDLFASLGLARVFALVAGALLVAPAAWAQDVEAGRVKAQVCFTCHGPNGSSTQPQFPILAGQTARYLYLQIKDFKEDRRSEPQMDALLKTLSREDMFDISAFFAAQKPLAPSFTPDPAKAAKGKAKAEETLCSMCHLGGLKGQNEIPRLAGQHFDYVVKQLKDFKAHKRTNDAGNMSAVSKTLSDEDIENLAHHIVGLD